MSDLILKPCPFCGSEPELEEIGNDRTAKRRIIVKCPKCRTQQTNGAIRFDMAWLRKVAIDGWNARALSQPAHAEPVAQANDDYEPPRHIFVLLRPGKVPRIGKPIGDPADSLRLWMKDNPDCDFIVLTSHDPDTYAESGREFLSIDRAFKQMEREELPEPVAQPSAPAPAVSEVPQPARISQWVDEWEDLAATQDEEEPLEEFIVRKAILWDRQQRSAPVSEADEAMFRGLVQSLIKAAGETEKMGVRPVEVAALALRIYVNKLRAESQTVSLKDGGE